MELEKIEEAMEEIIKKLSNSNNHANHQHLSAVTTNTSATTNKPHALRLLHFGVSNNNSSNNFVGQANTAAETSNGGIGILRSNNSNSNNKIRLTLETSAGEFLGNLLSLDFSNNNSVDASNVSRQTMSHSVEAIHPTQVSVVDMIRSHLWASSTWTQRSRLLERFSIFLQEQLHLSPDQPVEASLDWTLPMFVESTETAATTKLGYTKSLSALWHRLGHSTPITQMYAASLRAAGAMIPEHQAVAATQPQVERLLKRAEDVDARLMAGLFLMWKTASRFDDVARVTRASLLVLEDDEIIVSWGDRTKSTRSDPFRASAWTVVRHQQSMEPVVRALRQLQDDEALIDSSTADLVRWLKRDDATAQLTAHSFKRGALNTLMMKAATGVVDVLRIPVLAKHQHAASQFPAVTLRYVDPVAAARAMRTQELTIHLECLLPEEQRRQQFLRQVALVSEFDEETPFLEQIENVNSNNAARQQPTLNAEFRAPTVMQRVRERHRLEWQQQQQE